MARKSEFTEAVEELIREWRRMREEVARQRHQVPPFMHEAMTPSEHLRKFWGNAKFRAQEMQRMTPEELERIVAPEDGQ